MRQDVAFLFVVVITLSALGALVFQYYIRPFTSIFGGGSYDTSFDEFASPDDISPQYSCGDNNNNAADGGGAMITNRDLFSQTLTLGKSIKSGLKSDSRRDIVSWRTKRNQGLKRRPGAPDLAAFDAYRPAYDAMCKSVDVHSECFRPLKGADETSVASSSNSETNNNNNNNNNNNKKKLPSWAQAVRKQLRLWSPSTSAFMQRPTLLCVSLVADPDRIEHALTQWSLWGKNCDDFYIALQLPTADSTMVHNGTQDKIQARQRYTNLFRRYNLPLKNLWPVRPLVSWKIDDPVRFDRWQAFRELSRVMGDEDLMHPVYQAEYSLFVRDDTYVIPENVFGFLSSPEVRHLEGISSPVMLGHVLQVPAPSLSAAAAGGHANPEEEAEAQLHDNADNHHNQPQPQDSNKQDSTLQHPGQHSGHQIHDKTYQGPTTDEPAAHRRIFASFDGGMIWNRLTRKLFMNAIRSQDACAYANTEADDVMLADCYRFYGILPIDTADSRGSDRQHILRPEWAMTVGRDPKLVEWYSLFRGRPSLQGSAAISPTSMTFGGLNTIDELRDIHDYLSEN